MLTTGITGDKLSLANKFVKLSSFPITTLGLIITVLSKLFIAFSSPRNLDCWYLDLDSLFAPIAETCINFFTSYFLHNFAIVSGSSA